jgi:pyruvate dehydrogenase E1 component beta subunit
MATLTLLQAINDGLRTAMKEDPSVLVFGEDVGRKGGVFLATENLQKEFGASRCFDTPLSEDGIVGAAIGMAMNGLKPVAGYPVPGLHLPGLRPDRERGGKLRYRRAASTRRRS